MGGATTIKVLGRGIQVPSVKTLLSETPPIIHREAGWLFGLKSIYTNAIIEPGLQDNMAYLQRFLKIVYWKEEAREAEAHSGWPLYTITSKNIMAWALSRVLRDGPADTIVDRAELSLTTLGSAVDAAFQLETLCGARWSRQEFRVVADSMASLAKLNSPDMWFARYLTLIVKRPYAGVRLITWGHNKNACC